MTQENGERNPPNSQPEEPAVVDESADGAEVPVLVPATTPTGSRIERWLELRVFTNESTFLPLVFLWLLGVLWAVFELMRSVPKFINSQDAGELAPAFKLIVFIQIGLGLTHQFFVFRCIHVFDSDRPVWKDRFPNWIGTRWEGILRAAILLSLLAVGGEIPLLAKHIRDALQSYHRHFHVIPIFIYPLASVILYFLLVSWDIWGAARHPQANTGRPAKIWNLIRFKWPLTLPQVYFYSDLLCLVFWSAMFWCAYYETIGVITFTLMLLTAIFFAFMIILRVASHVRKQPA